MDSRHKELHDRANELLFKHQYSQAAQLYSELLESLKQTGQLTKGLKDLHISCLNKRATCHMKLEQYQRVTEDCTQILDLNPYSKRITGKALMCKAQALTKLNRNEEALVSAKQWTQAEPKNIQALKEYQRLKQLVEENKDVFQLDNSKSIISNGSSTGSRLDHRASTASPKASRRTPGEPSSSHFRGKKLHGVRGVSPDDHRKSKNSRWYCSYCNVQCASTTSLHMHCLSESHQSIITSDKGRDWKHRPPPRGVSSDEYILCPESQRCRFGERCTSAHSEEELGEWKERYRYRLMKWQKAKDRQLHGSSYAEQILEKWLGSSNPTNVMMDTIENVNVTVNSELNISISSKNSAHCWMFTLQCKGNRSLHKIALLHDIHRPHFNITHVFLGDSRRQCEQDIPNLCQEWAIPSRHNPLSNSKEHIYRVKLQFTSQIFGTFRQSIVFDFGGEPYIMKRVSADSVSASDKQKLEEVRDKFFSVGDRWDNTTKKVVAFSPKPAFGMEEDVELRSKYRPPRSKEELIPQSVLERYLTKNNYKTRMHELLFIEELTQFKEMSKYNVRTSLQIISSFLLVPTRGAGARYAQGGELFALLKLNNQLSSDTMGGRLILDSCSSALLATVTDERIESIVYEALIEEKSKDAIYFRLSKDCVDQLGVKADDMVEVELQFQLNRLPLCEWHYAVDQVTDLDLLFPSVRIMPSIPWTPDKQWMDKLDPRINSKQKEAVMAISAPLEISLPPVFLVGPYGTGKTFTLAHATKFVLQQKDTRILICTHSNSAADLYIRDYFHAYVEAGNTAARPLRIYFKNRWTQTVHPVVRLYCHMSENEDRFTMPSKEEVEKYRVIVATLSTSRYLNHLNLPQGFFTHILLDEAAQAIECEAVMPLSLANKDTRVVLAGDYMQISPAVYSEFARERNLHISLLERLYDLYPMKHPCKILLCENYRSNEVVVDFTSKLFYEAKLVASGKQPPHPRLYPLTFYTAKGEDIQEKNSTTYYNNAEVFEIAERVQELHKSWPSEWGAMEDGSIGVVTPYSDQVFRIRSELRRRKLHAVSVERVMNVQGKQFRALFISTVRTHHTCPRDVGPKSKLKPKREDVTEAAGEEADYGFLSDDKLLNTAITRAQSLVAIVGDPVSLCAIGKCRKLWEELIMVCDINDSLHGTSYAAIKAQLSSVEMKKTFILNPMAKEFIPRLSKIIMGAPVIQSLPSVNSAHTHSNNRMFFAYQGQQGRPLSAGNPLFSSQMRHSLPVGPFSPQSMFRSAAPMPVIDRFTGQRIVYVPVIPVPVRMVHNVSYPYLDQGMSYIPFAPPGLRAVSNAGLFAPPLVGSPPIERTANPSQDRSEKATPSQDSSDKAGQGLVRVRPQHWPDHNQEIAGGRNVRGVNFFVADSNQAEKTDTNEEHFQELIRPLMQQLQSQKSEDESRNPKPSNNDDQQPKRNGGHIPHDFHTGGAVGMPSLKQTPSKPHLKVKLGHHQETGEREPWQDVTLPFSPDRSDTEGQFFNGPVHKRLGERPLDDRNSNKEVGRDQAVKQEEDGLEVRNLSSREMLMRNEFFKKMQNPPELLVESSNGAYDVQQDNPSESFVLHASDTSPRTPAHFLEQSNSNDISLPSPFGESRNSPFGTRNEDMNFNFSYQHTAFNQDQDTTILPPPHTTLDYTRSSGESYSAFKCPSPAKWWSTNDNYIHSPQGSGPSTDVSSFHLSPGSQSSQDSAYQLSPSSPFGDVGPTATTAVPMTTSLTLDDTKASLGSMSYATALRTPKSKAFKSGGSQDGRSNTASPDPLSLIEDLGSRQKGGFYSIF